MIALLTGKPIVTATSLIIQTESGVGYEVHVAPSLLAQAQSSEVVTVFTHHVVREDSQELFGFASLTERSLFGIVLGVSGVGPKTALALIGAGAAQLIDSVQQANVSYFTGIPRVGKKLAQKIIIELRGKLGAMQELDLTPLSDRESDIAAALIALGFDEHLVHSVVRANPMPEASISDAIKTNLQLLQKA